MQTEQSEYSIPSECFFKPIDLLIDGVIAIDADINEPLKVYGIPSYLYDSFYKTAISGIIMENDNSFTLKYRAMKITFFKNDF